MSIFNPRFLISALSAKADELRTIARHLTFGTGTVVLIAGLLTGAAAFSSSAHVARDVIPLQIDNPAGMVEVRSPLNMILAQIHVRDGDRVDVGDPLFEIDTSAFRREKTLVEHTIEGLRIRRQRLMAEIADETGFEISPEQQIRELQHIVQAERLLLESRRRSAALRTDQARHRQAEAQHHVEALRNAVTEADKLVGQFQMEIAALHEMASRQHIAVSQLVAARTNARAAEESREQLADRLKIAEGDLAGANQTAQALAEQLRIERQSEIEHADRRINELLGHITKIKALASDASIPATARGIVRLSVLARPGSDIEAGTVIAHIVPVALQEIDGLTIGNIDASQLTRGLVLRVSKPGRPSIDHAVAIVFYAEQRSEQGAPRYRIRLRFERPHDVDQSMISHGASTSLISRTPQSSSPVINSLATFARGFIRP